MSEKQDTKEHLEDTGDIPSNETSNDDEDQETKEETTNEKKRSKRKNKDEELELLKEKHEELRDKHLRLFAEFDNFKKRTAKEKLEFIQMAGKDIIVDILPVLDDFERAVHSAEKASDMQAVIDGMKLIYHKLDNFLKIKGVEKMETLGEEFNSELHEAIAEVETKDKKMKGRIVDEIEKGYLLNDKIIRYAKVVVGK